MEKTTLTIEEGMPHDIPPLVAQRVLKQRLKDPAWSLAFCLGSDLEGILLLGELLQVSTRESNDAELFELPLPCDTMFVATVRQDGFPREIVEDLFGAQHEWPLLKDFPNGGENDVRFVFVNAGVSMWLHRIFLSGLVEAREMN